MPAADPLRFLFAAYDGSIPPAEFAAARWGVGALERLARGADAALIEARLRDCVAAAGRLRLAGLASGLGRLARAMECYRSVAISMLRTD